eukprot:COSAG01_NODE_2122_length_8373_cov_4.387962_1_plen_64_part_00
MYYSAKNIKACLVLKRPANAEELAPQLTTMGRVLCTTEYDERGMNNLQLSTIAKTKMVTDISL